MGERKGLVRDRDMASMLLLILKIPLSVAIGAKEEILEASAVLISGRHNYHRASYHLADLQLFSTRQRQFCLLE
jgi:hypothetical protein